MGGDEGARAGLGRSPVGREELLRLLAGGLHDAWWDDVGTPDREGREEILARVLGRLDRLGLPEAWGRAHRVELGHPLARMSVVGPLFDRLASRGPFAVGGDGTTVSAFGFDPASPHRVTSAPVLRMVVEVGDWDRTVVALAPGQSGQPWSPWATDQVALWLRGGGVPLRFSGEALEREAHARLHLVPP